VLIMSVDSFRPITREGVAITNLFWVVLALSALVLLVVLVPLVYSIVRFRGGPGVPDPPQVAGNRTIEIIWTGGAFALVAALFAGAVITMQTVSAATSSALRVTVIGHQWWWEYQYPDLNITTANELHLPTGQSSELEITSADVIHSFWVPQLGWKQDGNPGQTHTMWVQVDQSGTIEGTCAEYCGVEHAWMRIRVVAQPPDQFETWVHQQQQQAQAPSSDLEREGQQLFATNTCVNCHTVQGTSSHGQVGPDLTHVGSRSTIGAGVLDNTPENLQSWVQHADEAKHGVLMPNFNTLSDQQAQALTAYLESLQ
jgi:cytochrome c oxidase subunit 2